MAGIWHKIKAAFEVDENHSDDVSRQLHVATASLLFEMCRADFEIIDAERRSVRDAIEKTFHLTRAETKELLAQAEMQSEHAVSLQQFTSLINDHFDRAEKTRVIESLWHVAYADGVLHKYEEHLVRKLADLLYVSHSDYIKARNKVAEAVAIQ